MATDMPDKEAIEAFLNENQDFLGAYLAREELLKETPTKIIMTTPSTTMTISKCVEKLINHQRKQKQKLMDDTMSENQRFSEFVKDIAGELNVNALSHKILQNVINLTESERGRLFLVEETDEKFLVSKLFDVTATSCLDNITLNDSMALRIPFGKGIAGRVAETKMPMNIKNTHLDPRFDPDIDGIPGYKIRCILCMPILNKESDVVGVAEIFNKKDVDYFSEQDEVLFNEYLGFCGIGINNARLFQMSIDEINKNQLLLNLAWQISVGQSSIDKLAQVILEHAVKLIQSKFAKVYLFDGKGELFSQIYRMDNNSIEITVTKDEPADAYSVLAKECFDSKQTVGLIDLESEQDFVSADTIPAGDTTVDQKKVYEEGANCILFAPIRNPSDECIGCIMFAGKTKLIQNESNTNSAEAFAIYCGLGVYNCQLYEKTVKSLTAKEITMEILSYHLTSEKAEVQRFIHSQMPSIKVCNIYDIEFNDVMMNDVSTVQVGAEMFIKLNALDILGINIDNLYHWILTVKKNYKPLLYHNWSHALNVTQIMFCALSNGSLKNFFTPFECICILVATLCHDLDYLGFASAKNLKSTSLLATVYSTSSSEHPVLGRCIMILNAEATNIFRNLTAEKYREAMEFIKRAILSTDIYDYLHNVDYLNGLKKKKKPRYDSHDKEMLLGLAMVSCDLIAFSKQWGHHKMLVLTDVLDLLQPQESGSAWLSKNEIDKIPRMMVDFIDSICLKAFETMAYFDDIFARLYEACLKNRQIWKYMAEHLDEFNVENEVIKSRAGLIDFDEDVSSYVDKAEQSEVERREREQKEKKEKKEREQRDLLEKQEKRKREKEQRTLEANKQKAREEKERKESVEKERREREEKEAEEKKEKEKKEKKERKERQEKERREREEKERKEMEEKERKEMEGKERKEMEGKERKEIEEKKRKELEKKEKEEMEKKKKEEAAREAEEERKKKEEIKKTVEKKKDEERQPALLHLDESRSTISPSPTVSPTTKPRRSSKELESQMESVGRKLSSQKPDEIKTKIPLKSEKMARRKSDKTTRKSSVSRATPAEKSAKAALKNQATQKKSIPTDETKPAKLSVELADDQIKTMSMTTKRKCAPKAVDKHIRKSAEKSKLCAII